MQEVEFSRIMLPLCAATLLGVMAYAATKLARTPRFDRNGSIFFVYFGLLIGAGMAMGLGLLVLFFRHKVGGGGI